MPLRGAWAGPDTQLPSWPSHAMRALLAASVPNKVYSVDHVAINESVIACDMARTPLEDGTLDVVVFSLSLMGTNVEDYLKEAHRVLKLDGRLRIAETMSRWKGDKRAELLGMIEALGFRLIGTVEERDRFLYIDAIKVEWVDGEGARPTMERAEEIVDRPGQRAG
jgi:ubiquinone/menaquinone biosynthesis C-methylase UbiE